MRYETLQVITEQEVFQLSDLPDEMAPNFTHKDNVKFNSGHYKLLKKHRDGSLVYAYNFVKTTAASSASHANLELNSGAVKGPYNVLETEIIEEIPSSITYHPFVISKEGIGKELHLRAIEETAKGTAKGVLRRMKEKFPALATLTADVENYIVGDIIGVPAGASAVVLADQVVQVQCYFELHETDCTKQFFLYAQHLYPDLHVVSEETFCGDFFFTRYALSKEDSAIDSLHKGVIQVLLVKEIDEVDGYSGEGTPSTKKVEEPKSESQLLANMAKTSAMVAMQTIAMQLLFKKINVIGLLMNYELSCVAKVYKMTSDYSTGETVFKRAKSGEKIDRMLARVNAQFKRT